MAVREILLYPDPRLKQVSTPVSLVDGEVTTLVDDLIETMRAGPGGVGIAAPQVGRLERIVVVDVRSKLGNACHGRLVLINPEVVEWSGLDVGREGCMSVPDFTGNVIRAKEVVVQAQDVAGEERVYHFEGFEARAVQHEMDHLDGILFLDRLVSRKTDLFRRRRSR